MTNIKHYTLQHLSIQYVPYNGIDPPTVRCCRNVLYSYKDREE